LAEGLEATPVSVNAEAEGLVELFLDRVARLRVAADRITGADVGVPSPGMSGRVTSVLGD
jgi:hypothetical protein